MTERLRPLSQGEPDLLGAYRLLGRLGEGGMGVVYLALDPQGRQVAVKAIHRQFASKPEFLRRFRREVEAARRVPRFCTAAVLDAQLDGPQPHLVTEFVDGPSLGEAVAGSGPLPPEDLEALAVGVAAALVAIHEAGVVHRDLKPGNVLLSAAGPRVIDFGIASAVDTTSHTLTGQLMGTPAYMAPEQINGDRTTAAADVFAWGGVVAFAASGQGPFGQTTSIPAMMHRVLHEPPRLDALEPGLRSIVEVAMSKRIEARPSATDLLDRLVAHAEQRAHASAAAVLDQATVVPSYDAPTRPPPTGSPARPPGETATAVPGVAPTMTPTMAPPPGAPTMAPLSGPPTRPPNRPPTQRPTQGPPGHPGDWPVQPAASGGRGRRTRTWAVVLAAAAVLAVVLGMTAILDPLGLRGSDDVTASDDSGSSANGQGGGDEDDDAGFALPDYRGDDADAVATELDGRDITVRRAPAASGADQAGQVLRLAPTPGSQVSAGETVTLYVGDGSQVVAQDTAVYKRITGSINVADIIVRTPNGKERKVGVGDSPDISADGSRVVYVDTSDFTRGSQVVAIGADGSNRRTITDITVGSANYVAISPDGSRVAYANNTGGLFVMDIDGANKQTVADVDAFEIDWSPDGRQLVFRRYDTNDQELWMVGVDGSRLRRLPTPTTVASGGIAADPAWSPDGRSVVFHSFQQSIYVVPADGSGKDRLVLNGASSPSWTPDGLISYTESSTGDVYVAKPDGTSPVKVDGIADPGGPVQWGR